MKTKRTRSSFRSMSSKIHTLANEKDVFLLTHTIPHSLRFPHCDAVMHHGGAGTTHSVARTGKPQVIMPLIIDQPYGPIVYSKPYFNLPVVLRLKFRTIDQFLLSGE